MKVGELCEVSLNSYLKANKKSKNSTAFIKYEKKISPIVKIMNLTVGTQYSKELSRFLKCYIDY